MNNLISQSMKTKLDSIFKELPEYPKFDPKVRRAPKREFVLNEEETVLALKNALRYVPEKWHKTLAAEFLDELLTRGRIYAYRFRPQGRIYGKAIEEYKGKTIEGKALQVMIDNNLDLDVALYPYELVTYGETGTVLLNWMQYQLVMRYLEEVEADQTLVVSSGHPLGVFKSTKNAPRVIITNGLMIGLYDDLDNWNRAASLGVASYGQMTAGGWMYIGPQGIVHGTYSTLLNAGREKLGIPLNENLAGKLFVSSGLGGMSGAQGKAAEIAGGVGLIAEVDYSRIETRYLQGWIHDIAQTPEEAFFLASKYQKKKEPRAIAYYGNIVTLLEYANQNNIKIDLLSDQTSCHNVYDGGYCPVTLTYEERTEILKNDKPKFMELVNESLRRHYVVLKSLVAKGVYFFDYGNSFMKAIYDAGVKEICKNGVNPNAGFIWPSYVEDIMGPILFDYGYGPFRWVCLSGSDEDLDKTDQAALNCIDKERRFQDLDNYNWIFHSKSYKLVVGTKARILYQDAEGRVRIALRFNEMIRNGEIGPIMIGRDHHDTGGTDSPFRETSNIKDGSNIMAEMATQVFAGNCARGMSLATLHNGGGVGIGKAINGGFGLVLDGSERVDEIIKTALSWDVMGGIARRAWARNENSLSTAIEYNQKSQDQITLPYLVEEDYLKELIRRNYVAGGK
ncbi:MAG: urocanate hydratase [Bacilli bacterium]|nr:urocanate hydratase [Bacilli bacterium]